ncbi:MAG: hypothetical protein V1802_00705 [Candidatus Aenigmatarchaeota archaeon]
MTWRKSYPTKRVEELIVGDVFPDGGKITKITCVGNTYSIHLTPSVYGNRMKDSLNYERGHEIRVVEEAKKGAPGAHRK